VKLPLIFDQLTPQATQATFGKRKAAGVQKKKWGQKICGKLARQTAAVSSAADQSILTEPVNAS
jgi:hypothetical protein